MDDLQSYELTLVTDASTEPVTSTLAKKQCRVDYADEDALFAVWIPAARKLLEHETGIRLIDQVWRLTLEDWPRDDQIRLPVEPVSAVAFVKYYDADGTLTTLTASTDYLTWLGHKPPLVYPAPGVSWPALQYGRMDRIQVQFTAGQGASETAVSEIAKAAVLMTIGYWAENRGDDEAPDKIGLPPGALRLFRHLDARGYV